MKLCKSNLATIKKTRGVSIPNEEIFSLPEKVIQFGTGVLLRGLPDYFIDKANKQGLFNGRIVVVKSTNTGSTDAFNEQDGLYTLVVRGIENNVKVQEYWVNAAISRVLNVHNEWNDILSCAANPDMQIVISNTTEVGISLMEDDDIFAAPPVSFPGKLLAFLYHRFTIFNGADSSGMVIIPTELIVNNGKKLKEIIIELAKRNHLSNDFLKWLNEANDFCDSLVDRIVPGKLSEHDANFVNHELGYEDELMIMSEAYRLWAIETSSHSTKNILSFAKADAGVIIEDDISIYRELKLRLLNGTHTFSCGLAFLAGFDTVKEAMDNRIFASYVTNLMLYEIAPVILSEKLTQQKAKQFALQVLDRFRNPAIAHHWINITMQYTSKMKMRNVPLIEAYLQQFKLVPPFMALGIAGYLYFMQSNVNEQGQPVQQQGHNTYILQDDYALQIHQLWKSNADFSTIIGTILSNENYLNIKSALLPNLESQIELYLTNMQQNNVLTVTEELMHQQMVSSIN